ncbi:glucokinase [bacterium]|nr:glucokinase [bacterium]
MTAHTPQSARSLWLLADIGGTHARFAYAATDVAPLKPIATYEVARFSSFETVLAQLLIDWRERSQTDTQITKVCMAVAANPHQQEISFTNNPWRFTPSQVEVQTGCSDIQIVNDFAAVARSLPAITAPDLEQIGDGASQLGQPMVTIGPGTGCGVATLVFDDAGNAMVLPAEGGHVDFAPTTDDEMKVLGQLRAKFGRVSIERILSGPGIMNLYRALGEIHQLPITYALPEAVGDAARTGDRLAMESMSTFCSILGSVAGDLALTIGARGGRFYCRRYCT